MITQDEYHTDTAGGKINQATLEDYRNTAEFPDQIVIFNGIEEPFLRTSPWAAGVVLVEKKAVQKRVCDD